MAGELNFEAAYSKAVENGWDSVKDLARQIWDEARTHIHSQEGEAVAWRVTGRGGITVMAQYPEWAEADCLLTITPLYTHPADQVAEGVVVSRELLDLAYQAVHALAGMGIDGYTEGRCAELRQLLAKSEGVKK